MKFSLKVQAKMQNFLEYFQFSNGPKIKQQWIPHLLKFTFIEVFYAKLDNISVVIVALLQNFAEAKKEKNRKKKKKKKKRKKEKKIKKIKKEKIRCF